MSKRFLIDKCLIMFIIVGVLISNVSIGIPPADAFTVDVTVTIERIKEIRGFGLGDDPDFYVVITIDGHEHDNKDSDSQKDKSGDKDIWPDWQFTEPVDYSQGNVPVKIQVYEADGLFRGDDDYADLHPEQGKRALSLDVHLDPCNVSGHVTGDCETRLISSGNSDNSAMIYFSIEVSPPPAQGDLRVYCIHEPIFPEPGEDVTITVESLRTDPLNPGETIPYHADEIEIWVNSRDAPFRTGSGETFSESIGSFSHGDFFYGCKVIDDDVPMFTGYRIVSVGEPTDQKIPILYNGFRTSSIDVVFIPAKNIYSYDSSGFLDRVSRGVDGWLKYDVMKQNIDLVNFWIAKDTGELLSSGSVDGVNGCASNPPDNWDDDYRFADAGVLVHNLELRDCGDRGERFHTWKGITTSLRHEAGHVPFGLADEYCCNGGYFETEHYPNLYENYGDCLNPHPGVHMPSCRQFTIDNSWNFNDVWYTSDPPSDDLMVDHDRPRNLDRDRIEWVFEQCESSRC